MALSARPGLGVISFAQNAGGVAYVGRMLRRALRDAGVEPWTLELGVERRDAPTPELRRRFAARLVMGHLRRRADWMLYNHVGIARAHRLVPRPLRSPYGVFVHDVEAWSTDLDVIRRKTLADASVLIANSRYTARRVRSAHPDLGRVEACPLGLMDELPDDGLPDHALLHSIGERAALIVGRVASDERYKGHDQLIEAWPRVTASCPDARLVVAGWGDDIPRLQQKAQALGVGQALLFCGYVSGVTLRELYRRAALYVMPSAREGFGLVYLEAMRAAIPCIGSTLDAAVDVIADGETGYLVDRNNPAALAHAMVSLLRDPSRRAAMGEAGRRRYMMEFTYEHFRDRLLPILASAFARFVPDDHA